MTTFTTTRCTVLIDDSDVLLEKETGLTITEALETITDNLEQIDETARRLFNQNNGIVKYVRVYKNGRVELHTNSFNYWFKAVSEPQFEAMED